MATYTTERSDHWENREWNFSPGPWYDTCGWNTGRCSKPIIGHTPSRDYGKGIIGVCEEHYLRAEAQVKRGTRPWVQLLNVFNNEAVVQYLAEVARAG